MQIDISDLNENEREEVFNTLIKIRRRSVNRAVSRISNYLTLIGIEKFIEFMESAEGSHNDWRKMEIVFDANQEQFIVKG